MAAGDHFYVWRRHWRVAPFRHHGIDIGDGTVVHFTDGMGGAAGPGGGANRFSVERTTAESITRDGLDSMHRVDHGDRLPAEQTVARAIELVGTRDYHLLFHNCEHVASWCACDRYESIQVSVACERMGSAGVKAIASGAALAASRMGLRTMVRGASPLMLVADAAQWATEAGGQHVGLGDAVKRKRVGRAVGASTAIGIGALGGPVGIAVAGGLWCVGEVAGGLSAKGYEHLRQRRGASVLPMPS